MSVYLDYNASAPLRPEAKGAILQALDCVGNPSSIHKDGRRARAIIEAAREQIANLVGAKLDQVVFTSGGTEANVLGLGSAIDAGFRRVILSAVEHDCVYETLQASGPRVQIWPVNRQGVVDLDWLADQLRSEDGPALVTLMLVHNETGVIQPVAEAAELVRAAGGWLHVDAVQAAGKIEIAMADLQADSLALSAHKIGGPQGVGALVAGPRTRVTRRWQGGGQERGRRPGTENVPGIAGFGAAACVAACRMENQAAWRDAAAAKLRAAGGLILGEGALRVANTLCVAHPGLTAELQLMRLDLAGIRVSAGAACSSGKVKASRTIEAMGWHDLASLAIRVSSGWASTSADWSQFVDAWLALPAQSENQRKEFA